MSIYDAFPKHYLHSINNSWLQCNPFYAYSIKKEETKRGFLSKEEIKLMIDMTHKKRIMD